MRNPLTQQRAQVLRSASTDTERFLWHRLRRRQLLGYRFRRQVPIGMYVADFACIEAKLVVEVDGSQHQEHRAYDLKREEYLTECGFQVLRFWDNEVLAQTDAVLETISRVLTSRRPHPSLPPQAGEGS